MHVLAAGLRLGDRTYHRLAEIIRMRTGEPQPPHPLHRSHRSQQVGEVVAAIEVRVDGLTEEHDLRYAGRDRCLRFANYFGELPAALGTAGGRNDAVGASVVAAALDRNPGLHAVEPPRSEVLVVLLEVEVGRRRARAPSGALDQRRQLAVAIGTDHETDVLHAIQKLGA